MEYLDEDQVWPGIALVGKVCKRTGAVVYNRDGAVESLQYFGGEPMVVRTRVFRLR